MIYNLDFEPKALKEWSKLDSNLKNQFKKKIEKIIVNPKIEKNKLSGHRDLYKIKLKQSGYRLIYKVKDQEVSVIIVKIGKRENNEVYTFNDKLKR